MRDAEGLVVAVARLHVCITCIICANGCETTRLVDGCFGDRATSLIVTKILLYC